METKYIILGSIPFITAFIGWLTNWVAIKMLFRPQNPSRFMGLFPWQGLIPKRRNELAEQIAEVIERELISNHVIRDRISQVNITPQLSATVSRLVRERLATKLRDIPLVGNFINDKAIDSLERMALEEVAQEGPLLMSKVADQFESHFDVRNLVKTRIHAFDLDRLEAIVNEVALREFRTIERLGAILGFTIGCAQLGLLAVSNALG